MPPPPSAILSVHDSNPGEWVSTKISTWRSSLVAGINDSPGCIDGASSSARFRDPTGSEVSPDGATIYVADGGCRAIRAVDAVSGTVSTIAGTLCTSSCAGYPWADGVGAAAVLSAELGQMQISPDGSFLYFADATANRVRAVELATRRVFTIAGNSTWAPPITEAVAGVQTERAAAGYRDGAGGAAVFNRIRGLVLSEAGDNMFTTENPAGVVRAIVVATASTSVSPSPSVSPSASSAPIADGATVVSTVAGGGSSSSACFPPLTSCSLGELIHVQPRACTDQFFELITISGSCVKLISSISGVTPVAGSCGGGSTARTGSGDVARFKSPASSVFTGAGGTGDLIVVDSSVLRMISLRSFNSSAADPRTTVNVTHFAGDDANPTGCAYAEGTGGNARFCKLGTIKRLSTGDFLVYDKIFSVMRLVTKDARTSLLAGTPNTRGMLDGPPNIGRFCDFAADATEDYMGSVYVTDYCQLDFGRKSAGRELVAPVEEEGGERGVFFLALSSFFFSTSYPTPLAVLRRIDLTTMMMTTVLGRADAPGLPWPAGSCTYTKRLSAPSMSCCVINFVPASRSTTHAVDGYANGDAASAQLTRPTGLALDSIRGAIYIVCSNARGCPVSNARALIPILPSHARTRTHAHTPQTDRYTRNIRRFDIATNTIENYLGQPAFISGVPMGGFFATDESTILDGPIGSATLRFVNRGGGGGTAFPPTCLPPRSLLRASNFSSPVCA